MFKSLQMCLSWEMFRSKVGLRDMPLWCERMAETRFRSLSDWYVRDWSTWKTERMAHMSSCSPRSWSHRVRLLFRPTWQRVLLWLPERRLLLIWIFVKVPCSRCSASIQGRAFPITFPERLTMLMILSIPILIHRTWMWYSRVQFLPTLRNCWWIQGWMIWSLSCASAMSTSSWTMFLLVWWPTPKSWSALPIPL